MLTLYQFCNHEVECVRSFSSDTFFSFEVDKLSIYWARHTPIAIINATCTTFLMQKRSKKYEVIQQQRGPYWILSSMLSKRPFQAISFRRSVTRLAHFPVRYESCHSTFRSGANIHPKLRWTSNLLGFTAEQISHRSEFQHTTPHLSYRKALPFPGIRQVGKFRI